MLCWELSNKMKAIVSSMNDRKIVSIGLFFKVGSQDESDSTNGITHLVEHIISEKFLLDSLRFGFRSNAITTKEYCCYFSKILKYQLFESLQCIRTIVEFNCEQEILDKAKKIVINEMKNNNIDEINDEQIFGEHLWSESLRFAPIGRIDNVKKMSLEDVRSHFENYITPSNCVLSIAGDINELEAKNMVDTLFGGWLAQGVSLDPRNTMNSHKVKFSKIITSKHPDSTIRILFDGVPYTSDRKNAYELLCNYFGGGFHSKLFEFVRRKHSYAYNAFCIPQFFSPRGIVYVKIAGISKNSLEVLEKVSEYMLQLSEEVVFEEDLESAKRNLIMNYFFQHETVSSKMTLLGKQLLFDQRIIQDEEYVESINKLSPNEINRVFANMLLGNITISVDNCKNSERDFFNRKFV